MMLAILLYPEVLVSIAENAEFSKVMRSHSKLNTFGKKSWKVLLENDFFKMNKLNSNYGFLNVENNNDTAALDRMKEIYCERTKIIYKNE